MVLPEGTDISHTYLLFSVKDQSPVLGEGLLLGEALLPLKDIVKEDGDISLKVRIKPVVPKSVTGWFTPVLIYMFLVEFLKWYIKYNVKVNF